MTTVCLNMIVKNESKIIKRSLCSVIPFIDTYVIHDTGSTDGTQKIIKSIMKEAGIPGIVTNRPFENFGQARNAALLSAERSSSADWFLLMDADMELEFDRSVADVKQKLAISGFTNSYLVPQYSGGIVYENIRLVRNIPIAPARYTGVTHEYISIPGERGSLNGYIHFIDYADGGNRPEKFERDLELLTAGLIAEPTNSRYMFYLANTYFDLGRYEEAIEWYNERVNAGGWTEEQWYAKYRIAQSLAAAGADETEVYTAFMDAFRMRPSRAEPLARLAEHLAAKEEYEVAGAIKSISKCLPKPQDILFVEHGLYA